MKCKYCQPPNEGFLDDLGANILGDNEEIHVAINDCGYLEVSVNVDTDIWSSYLCDYFKTQRDVVVKINYCPICGRKL